MPKGKGFTVAPGAGQAISGAIAELFTERLGPAGLSAMQNVAPVRSGALYRSLSWDVEGGEGGGEVTLRLGVDAGTGENVTYGRYVEEGTSRMKAQPFMRPALGQIGARVR